MTRADVTRRALLRATAGAAGAGVVATAGAADAGVVASTGAGTAGAADAGARWRVEMTDENVFVPEAMQVRPGDTVVWENVGSASHTVTAYEEEIPDGADYWASGAFPSESAARDGFPDRGVVETGQTYQHAFETEGVHEYFCIPHESLGMTGLIEVTPDAPTPTPDPDETETPYSRPTRPPNPTVEMTDDNYFRPAEVVVERGTEVVWENVSEVSHTVTAYADELPEGADYWASGGFESEQAAREAYPDGVVESGWTYSHTFDTLGTHEYFCIPHEAVEMTGTVEVVEASTPTASTARDGEPDSTPGEGANTSVPAPGPGAAGALAALALAAWRRLR